MRVLREAKLGRVAASGGGRRRRVVVARGSSGLEREGSGGGQQLEAKRVVAVAANWEARAAARVRVREWSGTHEWPVRVREYENFLFPTAHLCSAVRWGITAENNSIFGGPQEKPSKIT
jgi:hypothetical protein